LQAFCHSHRLYLEIKLPAKKTFLSRSICFLGCLLCIISINVKSICRDIVLADEAHIFSPTLLSSDFNYHHCRLLLLPPPPPSHIIIIYNYFITSPSSFILSLPNFSLRFHYVNGGCGFSYHSFTDDRSSLIKLFLN
jgi:hypothetical protein